eukprot:gene10632-19372_t
MVYHENKDDPARCSSRPGTRLSSHDCTALVKAKDRHDAATQVSQKIKVSSVMRRPKAEERIPSDIHALPDQRFVADIHSKDTLRPKSANVVLQYADIPIQITEHHLGRPTRATVLRNLRRSQSASSICSDFSWIQDNRRLCNIRDYYRLFKLDNATHGPASEESEHAYLTGARFNSAHWLDSHTLKRRGLYINKVYTESIASKKEMFGRKEATKNSQRLLEVRGKGLMKDISVNTEHHYLSIDNWHGADWQRNLPEMYQPIEEKYNPNTSVVIRAKRVKSEYRDPVQMAVLKARRSKSAN